MLAMSQLQKQLIIKNVSNPLLYVGDAVPTVLHFCSHVVVQNMVIHVSLPHGARRD